MKKVLNFLILITALVISSSAFAEDMFGYGIELVKQSDSIVVNDVIINSNADKLGLVKSNVIVSINGISASDLTEEYLKDIDKQEKIILITSENKKISLKPENLTILDKYNKFGKYNRFSPKEEKRIKKIVSDPNFNIENFLEHRKKQEEEFVVRQKKIEESIQNAKNAQEDSLSSAEKAFLKNNPTKINDNTSSNTIKSQTDSKPSVSQKVETSKNTSVATKPTTSTNTNKTQTAQPKPVNVVRTKPYPKYFYDAAKDCESQIKIGYPASVPINCIADNLANPTYYINGNVFVNGTLPALYASMMNGDYMNTAMDRRTVQAMMTVVPFNLGMQAKTYKNLTIDQKIYNKFMYGK